MTTLPKLPEPDFVNNDFPELRPIRYYTEAQMLAFQAATVEACIEAYRNNHAPILAMQAMLKEKTE
jgi:hypothetical protein